MSTLQQLTTLPDDELNVMLAELASPWSPEIRKRYGGCDDVRGWGINQHLDIGHPERVFSTHRESLPNYTASLDEVAKVVDFVRQDDLKYFYYQMHLNSVMAIYNSLPERQAYRSIATCDAPPRQRTIALVATLQMK